ncbi:ATP-binding cassette domain-containing protein [Schaalia canis]|uniref:ATP-binding cassette domain-containing protein n=1 Tax=Schaalia canis TaxID=100469 RepID=A0A3P1SG52_9ACTO|nr:ATP-binding cassette domain-containing protein [Schaalia canis]RRC95976.1 ATP-binding cassette domain-containing protein [Schaalia canis]
MSSHPRPQFSPPHTDDPLRREQVAVEPFGSLAPKGGASNEQAAAHTHSEQADFSAALTDGRPGDTQAPSIGARVEARNWGWRHAGRRQWTLRNINLTISPGERVLLLGASGAGKSTLVAGLAGVLGGADEGEDEGTLTVDGLMPEKQRGRVGMVMQDPEAQVVLARVGDDVAFGCENLGVAREEIWRRVSFSLESVGASLPLDHSTSALSGGQKQRLALASILAMKPGLILLDEPTANLDPSGVREVRDATQRVVDASGATVVIIEHRVDVWADFIDRVIVILDGMIAADGSLDEVLRTHGESVRAAGIWLPGDEEIAADEALFLPSQSATVTDTDGGTALRLPVLSARHLAVGYEKGKPIRSGMNLQIPTGQSTCIIGGNGLGKSTLALTLAGLLPQLEGSVEVGADLRPACGGADPHGWSSRELLGRISMVFQEPEYQFLGRTVRAELEIGPRLEGVSGAELDALVDEHLDILGLRALAQANPMTLSGGEKRRLSVATALISAPKLLILDEPTFGQDRSSWMRLVQLLRQAVRRGTTLVSITHDDAFVRAMGDHVIDLANVGEAGGGASESLTHDAPKATVTINEAEAPASSRETVAHVQGEVGEASASSQSGRADEAPKEAPLDRVNPVVQVLGVALMTTPLLTTIDVVSAGVAMLLELCLLPLAGLRLRTFFLRMSPIFIAAPMAALSMLLYGKPGGEVYWAFGPAIISEHSTLLAASIFLRVFALAMPAIVVFPRIDPTDMADGLTQLLKMPARPVIASLAAARMAGMMAEDWRGLQRARRVRGAGEGNRFGAFFRGAFSLLVFALRRSAKLSLTMEARGFGAGVQRSFARVSRVGWADAVMLVVCVIVPLVSVVAAIWAGTFLLLSGRS